MTRKGADFWINVIIRVHCVMGVWKLNILTNDVVVRFQSGEFRRHWPINSKPSTPDATAADSPRINLIQCDLLNTRRIMCIRSAVQYAFVDSDLVGVCVCGWEELCVPSLSVENTSFISVVRFDVLTYKEPSGQKLSDKYTN